MNRVGPPQGHECLQAEKRSIVANLPLVFLNSDAHGGRSGRHPNSPLSDRDAMPRRPKKRADVFGGKKTPSPHVASPVRDLERSGCSQACVVPTLVRGVHIRQNHLHGSLWQPTGFRRGAPSSPCWRVFVTRDRSGSLFGWWVPSHAPASMLHSPRARPSHPLCLCRCRAVAPPSRPCAAVEPLRRRCGGLALLCAALSPLVRADGQRLLVRMTGTVVARGVAHRDRSSGWCGLPCCTQPRAPARLFRARSLCGACWGGCWRRSLASVVSSGGSGGRVRACLRAGRALACTVGTGGGGGHGFSSYPRRWLEALITKVVCTCVTMTRCLLCGFDSGAQSGHTQVSCALRSVP